MQSIVWKTGRAWSAIQVGAGKKVFKWSISAKAYTDYAAICDSSNYIFTGIIIYSYLVWTLPDRYTIVPFIPSGALLDQRRCIFYLEYIRILIVMIAIAVFYPNNWAFSGIITAIDADDLVFSPWAALLFKAFIYESNFINKRGWNIP